MPEPRTTPAKSDTRRTVQIWLSPATAAQLERMARRFGTNRHMSDWPFWESLAKLVARAIESDRARPHPQERKR